MTRRFRDQVFLLVAAGFLALTVSCSKSAKTDKSDQPAPAAEPAQGTNERESGDLEAAIAAPGLKTVTAVGADGKTEVLELGKTTLAETDTYLVNANVPASTAAGADGFVTINLTPKTGWKINQEFPTKLKVAVPEGVKVASSTQSASDAESFTEKSAVFKVPFNSESAGSKDFSAEFRFAVCTDVTCDPKKADLAWTLNVK